MLTGVPYEYRRERCAGRRQRDLPADRHVDRSLSQHHPGCWRVHAIRERFGPQFRAEIFNIFKQAPAMEIDPRAEPIADRRTAACWIPYQGQNELVQLRLPKGAKLGARTSRGWSVTHIAMGPALRASVPTQHSDTVALPVKLGAPPLTAVEGEEILGIIKGTAPALRTKAEGEPAESEQPGSPAPGKTK